MLIAFVASLAALSPDPAAARPANPSQPPVAAVPTVSPSAQTREVCRREREPGSNLSQRVCRQVPVNSSARDRSASDRVRESQGSRTQQTF